MSTVPDRDARRSHHPPAPGVRQAPAGHDADARAGVEVTSTNSDDGGRGHAPLVPQELVAELRLGRPEQVEQERRPRPAARAGGSARSKRTLRWGRS